MFSDLLDLISALETTVPGISNRKKCTVDDFLFSDFLPDLGTQHLPANIAAGNVFLNADCLESRLKS